MSDAADAGHEEPLVPARMVNEVFYCERLVVLEWAQREWADNVFTAEGRAEHARVDEGGGELDGAPGATVRSLELSSTALGLTAKIDLVEASEDGSVTPIETKRGRAPNVPEGAHLPERAQLGAHVLLLREHGYRCSGAAIYFTGSRRRVPVQIDEALLQQVREAIPRIRNLVHQATLPPPLEGSPKCDGCSLASICLPDEVTALRAAGAAPSEQRLRPLVPARDDRVPVYVTEPGARVGVDGGELVIRTPDAEVARARLTNTSHVSLFGNVQISTQAMKRLFERGIDVSFFSRGGWLEGRASSFASGNVDVRLAQVRVATDSLRSLALARGFVEAKIHNSRTLLRRNHPNVERQVLFELEQLGRKAERAESIEALLGIEGTAARTYFGSFAGMLARSLAGNFEWEGRSRRPPKDPVNALLSLAYALLTRDVAHAVAHAGLDPLLGFYHRPRFGRPALALDVMEELRPILADSTVLTAVNTGVIGPDDFQRHPTGVALRAAARRRFLEAYEHRMSTLVTHPTFGYRISWRRTLEVQARLLARHLLGDVPTYPSLRPR